MGAAISYCSPQQALSAAICDDGKGPDYNHLPCPVKYEEITREAYMSLKPELFEGLRFDVTRSMNQKFALSNSLFMGSVDVPGSSSGPVVKQSAAHFELGANLIDQKGKMDIVLMMGRILSDGRMSARVKYDVNGRFSIKANAQLTNEPHFTVGMFNFDYKGNDYQAQLTMGNNAFYGVNYMQSVTPTLSFGGEGIWLGHQRKSGMSLAGRYKTDTVCRVRGRVDTNLCTAAYLEEKFSAGLTILLSAELDHRRKDYKFGFGLTVED